MASIFTSIVEGIAAEKGQGQGGVAPQERPYVTGQAIKVASTCNVSPFTAGNKIREVELIAIQVFVTHKTRRP